MAPKSLVGGFSSYAWHPQPAQFYNDTGYVRLSSGYIRISYRLLWHILTSQDGFAYIRAEKHPTLHYLGWGLGAPLAYFWDSTSYIGSLAAPGGCGQTRQAFVAYCADLNTNKQPPGTTNAPPGTCLHEGFREGTEQRHGGHSGAV